MNPISAPEYSLLENFNISQLKVNNGILEQKGIFDYIKLFLHIGLQEHQQNLYDRLVHIVTSSTRIIFPPEEALEVPVIEIAREASQAAVSLGLIRTIFLERLPKYEQGQTIIQSVIADENLQNMLSPQLAEQRRIKEPTDIDVKIEEARLAIKLGFGLEPAKGTTGTMLIHGLNGRKIGVYKPTDDYYPWTTKISQFFKKTFGQAAFLSDQHNVQSKNEVAAAELSRMLELDITPDCVFIPKAESLDGYSEGTFQAFLEGYDEAKDHLGVLNKFKFDPEELDVFQKFAIFDFLIGNLDRHAENWFVKVEQGKLIDIQAIDNANSFPARHRRRYQLDNQYQWANYKISHLPFGEKAKEFAEETLNGLINMDDENEDMEHIFPFLAQMEDEALELLFKRAQILKKLIQTGFSPSTLHLYKTERSLNNLNDLSDNVPQVDEDFPDEAKRRAYERAFHNTIIAMRRDARMQRAGVEEGKEV